MGAGVGYTAAVLAADAPQLDGLKGQQLENVPKWNGSANARYSFPAFAGYEGFLRGDATFVGISYPDFDRTDPATFQRAYELLDLRAGLLRDVVEWNVFINNVTGKQAALSKFIPDNYDASTRTRMFTNRPRTIGLSVSYRY
jgi:hypothetical protein